MPHTDSRIPVWARPWRRRLLLGVGSLLLAGLVLLVAALAWLTPQLPSLDPVTTYQPRQPLQVFTVEGEEIAQFGTERRQFVPIERMPRLMQQAVLAVEDTRFYDHSGIDLKGLARALYANLSGGMRQGASTITQQVARTFFLSHRFTPERKLKEALLAMEIERRLPKDRILELYMNQIFLGQRAYGFAAAADTYFGKPLDQLSIAETAMLAGLPQNPHYANPVTNLARAQARQRIVLQRMLATGVITADQAEAARAAALRIGGRTTTPMHAEYVAEMARRTVIERFGPEAYQQGLKVYTSVRAADQQAAWAAVRRGVLGHDARQPWRGPEGQARLSPANGSDLEAAALQALKDYRDDDQLRLAIVLAAGPRSLQVLLASGERLTLAGDTLRLVQPVLADRRAPAELAVQPGSVIRVMQPPGRSDWVVTQWPEVEAALVSMDPDSGRVRALVGGFDHARQPFNHVTQAWRQPGSAFKPFLYSAALEHGVMPDTLVNDAPLNLPDGSWDPQNSDGSFDGPITVRRALARSKNLVSIRLLQQVGLREVLPWVGRFGFDVARQPDNLTLALGAGSTTPLQLARAYAVLANGGWPVTPVVIERITDAQGKLLYEAPPATQRTESARLVPARNVFITNQLLNGVVRYGTAARAQQQLGRSDLYGKTGTTNDAVDAWFAGFHPSLVAVVWLGYDQPQSLGVRETGGGLALPVWIQYMAQALKGVPPADAPAPPEGAVFARDEWRYAEFAEGGGVARIGLARQTAEAADASASAPEGAASGPADTAAPVRPAAPGSAPTASPTQ
jgi:penicillin-binding protein 1A